MYGESLPDGSAHTFCFMMELTAAAAAAAAAAPPGPGTVMKQQAMRTSINKLMDKLFDVRSTLHVVSWV